MTTEQLHKFHTARPFKPFRMHVADGRALRVDHPEMLAYVPKARTCAMWIAREKAFETIDLLLITTLEPFLARHRKNHGLQRPQRTTEVNRISVQSHGTELRGRNNRNGHQRF